MRAKEFIVEYKDPPEGGSGPFFEPETIAKHFDRLVTHYIKQGATETQAYEVALDMLDKHHGDDARQWMQEHMKEGDVIPFPKRPHPADDMSDEEKYKMAVQNQQEPDIIHREDVGVNPCKYCGDVYCDYDCNDSQNNLHKDSEDEIDVHKFANDPELDDLLRNAGMRDYDWMDEGSKENANALVGSGRADPDGKKTNSDSKSHKKVRTPTTTYSKDRKKYNSGAAPGANDGFVG